MGRPCQDCIDPEITGCQCSETDSDTVSVSGDGSSGNPFVHSVKKSANANNGLTLESDGLYVPSDQPLCRADRTGGEQVMTKDAINIISFNHTVVSNDSMHSGSVDPTMMKFNSAGVFCVGACLSLSPASTATFVSIGIRLNGSLVIVSEANAPILPTDFLVSTATTCSTLWQFDVGDYFEVQLRHDNDTDVNLDNYDAYSPVMWAYRVST